MARVLIVDDDAAVREGLAEALAGVGHDAIEAADGEAALGRLDRGDIDAVLLDLRMPGLDGLEVLRRIGALPEPPPVAVLTAVATATNTIEAMRLGAVDHLTKPVGRAELTTLLARMLIRPSPVASPEGAVDTEEIVGASAPMRAVQKTIGMVADGDATVLIVGETGTGKEVVARAIHRHGKRSGKPFVAINCAAIPSELLESQLFGHVRGAFTGAVSDRRGSFREADGGTLFLDEIGDMPLPMQAKLLRVLQDRIVTPLGGKPVPIDVRIIAATHRDLRQAVAAGSFREDLFYRLGVVPVHLPPLRERLADILPLAEHFLASAVAGSAPKHLSAEAAARLLAHGWPGNVRELRNAMERVATLVRQPVVSAVDLDFLTERRSEGETDLLAGDLPTAVARLEAAMIRRALAACGGNRSDAAQRLNINRQMLYTKMRRYGIEMSGNTTSPVADPDAEARSDGGPSTRSQ